MPTQFQNLAQIEISEINLYINGQLIFTNNAKIIQQEYDYFSINNSRTIELPRAKKWSWIAFLQPHTKVRLNKIKLTWDLKP